VGEYFEGWGRFVTQCKEKGADRRIGGAVVKGWTGRSRQKGNIERKKTENWEGERKAFQGIGEGFLRRVKIGESTGDQKEECTEETQDEEFPPVRRNFTQGSVNESSKYEWGLPDGGSGDAKTRVHDAINKVLQEKHI